MTFVVADPNLSITVAATSENKLVLYHRTNLVDTFELPDDCQGMGIRHVLRLGKRNVGEKKLSAQLLVGVLLGGEVDVSNNVNGVWLKGRDIISIVGWVEHLPDLSSPSLGETSLLEGDPV